jgi:SPP1 family predicted phage head-tail adaptor
MIRRKNTASRLKHRMTLQQEVITPDSAGGYEKSWADVAQLWAEIAPVTATGTGTGRMSGREVMVGGQLQPEISHRITVRYQEGVTAAMRLVYEGRVFNIRQVANVLEQGEVLELLAQEGAGT